MGVEVPKLVEAKRISWMNLVMVLGSLIGLWAILAVFSDASGSLSVIEGAKSLIERPAGRAGTGCRSTRERPGPSTGATRRCSDEACGVS